MTFPLLKRYVNTPFNAGTEVFSVQTFIGDALTTTFALDTDILTGLQVGAAVQVETTIKPRATGASTVSGDNVIIDTAPGVGQGIVVPGSSAIVIPCSDQNDALGRTILFPLYMADVETIQFYSYKKVPGETGILLEFKNLLLSGAGAQESWFTLAAADPVTGANQSFSSVLSTPDLKGQSYVDGAHLVGDDELVVEDGSVFVEGDFLMIDQGQVNQEVVKITSISGNTIQVPGELAQNHSDGALVLACGRKFWGRIIVPLNAAGGIPRNLYNITLETYVMAVAR
jgi:hypothetical protein